MNINKRERKKEDQVNQDFARQSFSWSVCCVIGHLSRCFRYRCRKRTRARERTCESAVWFRWLPSAFWIALCSSPRTPTSETSFLDYFQDARLRVSFALIEVSNAKTTRLELSTRNFVEKLFAEDCGRRIIDATVSSDKWLIFMSRFVGVIALIAWPRLRNCIRISKNEIHRIFNRFIVRFLVE